MTEKIRLLSLKLFSDRRGTTSVFEDIPFKVNRVFFVYNVPMEEVRGGHAHKKCHQLLIATCGAVLVKVSGNRDYVLDCPDTALYVPPSYLIQIIFLSDDSVLTVLASEKYDKDDYIYGAD